MNRSRAATAAFALVCAAACSKSGSSTSTALTLAIPATVVAGVPAVGVVSVVDGSGRPRADFRGTVHFTSEDDRAVLPADYTFTAGDAGFHSFELTLVRAGTR